MLHLLNPEIDYLALAGELSNYKSIRDKVSSLVRSGDLIRVRKGLYVLADKYKRPYSSYLLANLIYGPSHVSGISALAYYGAIPERVVIIHSKAMGKSKVFDTPVGRYVYRNSCPKRYACELSLCPLADERYFLISSPEKALIEEIIEEPEIKNSRDIGEWLASNRIADEFLETLRLDRMNFIQAIFGDKRIDFLVRWLYEESRCNQP